MKKILGIALAMLLSGCGLWNDYVQPKTETPKAWNASKDHDAWPAANWWEEFHSPQLTALMAQAKAANPDLQAAVARVRQADAQLRIAGAPLLPSVEANAGGTRQKSAAGRSSFSGTGSKPFNTFTATASASYELDFWGKNWSAQEAARAGAEASRFDREVVALTITSSVADTYFALLGSQARLEIAHKNLETAQKLLESFRLRFAQGTVAALDVAQQENAVATQAAAIPPLELQLRQNMDALSILLGALPENLPAPTGTLLDVAAPSIAPGLPSELLERRPDVQEAEANLMAANANIINARAQFFPSIGLTGERGYASPALSGLFNPASILYSVAANAAQPIFEGGLLEGQLELAHGRYDELLADYRKSILAAFSDVEDSLTAAQTSAAQVNAQAEAVRTAQTAYDLSQQQLEAGIVDITTVLNTQKALFAAQDAYAQAKITQLQAAVGLYKALGGGWSGQVK